MDLSGLNSIIPTRYNDYICKFIDKKHVKKETLVLRTLLLYFSEAGWMRAFVTHFFLARRVALRFVAGETLEEAIQVTRTLNEKGLLVTLDFLGESVKDQKDARAVTEMYLILVDRIHQENLNASVSLKPTHLGLDISEEHCVNNIRAILTAAKRHDIPVTMDMESSKYTDITLQIFRTMRLEHEFDNVGTVIQSALRRSEQDMKELAEEGSRIRLCKGAYLEAPDIAYAEKVDVDANYVRILDQYLQAEAPAYLDIATHDEHMIVAAIEKIKHYDIPLERYEFQMLYGVRSSRQLELVEAGYKMRVYVPFGDAWYPYFMRRLAERPANLWFFARSLFRS